MLKVLKNILVYLKNKESYKMKFLHTMIRINNIEESLDFFCDKLGLVEIRRKDVPEEIELTYNWEFEEFDKGRNFGHLAFSVKNIYKTCQNLIDKGVVINRPPRDGRMAFIKSPNEISIELLQQGEPLEIMDPWKSMKNEGTW